MKTLALSTLIILSTFLLVPLIPAHAAYLPGTAPASAGLNNTGSTDTTGGTPSTPTTPSATPAASTAAPSTESAGFVPLAPIPGLTDVNSNITSSTLTGFLNNLYLYLIGAAATLAVIMIIWGGLEISTQDSVSKHGDGVQKIQQAILGLVLVLSPVLVFSIINPSILNLSLALPPLDTASGGISSSPSASTPVINDLQDLQTQICTGYSEVKVVQIPLNQSCVDVVGPGWVGIPDTCAGAAVASGYSTCGLDKNYQPPSTTPTPTITSGSYFAAASEIPSGSWCYQVSQGFLCDVNADSCAAQEASEPYTVTVISSCKKY